MSELLIPLAGAFCVVWYWVLCRQRSLVHRERAADLLVAYFAKHGVTETEKVAAERFYLNARFWIFMPVMTVLVFPVLLISALAKEPPYTPTKDRAAITEAVIKMYMTRNPLTGTACMIVFFVAALLAQLIGLLINRVRGVPSPTSIYAMTAKMLSGFSKHAH